MNKQDRIGFAAGEHARLGIRAETQCLRGRQNQVALFGRYTRFMIQDARNGRATDAREDSDVLYSLDVGHFDPGKIRCRGMTPIHGLASE